MLRDPERKPDDEPFLRTGDLVTTILVVDDDRTIREGLVRTIAYFEELLSQQDVRALLMEAT